MQEHGISITRNEVYCLLQACEKRKDLKSGRLVQNLMIHGGLDSVGLLADHSIRLFGCNGELFEANEAFTKVGKPTIYTWAPIISANAKFGQGLTALELFNTMHLWEVTSNSYGYVAALKTCSLTDALSEGRLIHNKILNSGIQADITMGSTLVDMYAKCGMLEEASDAFDKLLERDVVSWNVMISGYALHGATFLALECLERMQNTGLKPDVVTWGAVIEGCTQNGNGLLALSTFVKMQQAGINPDEIAFSSVLRACAFIEATEQGRLIHSQVINKGLKLDAVIGSTLVDMYAKCGSLGEAFEVFKKVSKRDVVSWGALIAGYVQNGEGFLALEYYERMQQEDIKPDEVIFSSILKACGSIGAVEQGRHIHDQIAQTNLQLDVVVGSALIDMYGKCGDLEMAAKVFHELPIKNVVSWGAVIAGYAQHDQGYVALQYFEKMQQEGMNPNEATFLGALKACSSTGAIDQGRKVHGMILECGHRLDGSLGNTLVDMYAKCGNLKEANRVFEKLENQDLISWNAILAGYAQHGEAFSALEYFDKMQEEGIRPNDASFSSIFIMCSRAGLVDEGHWFFKNMVDCHCVIPVISHCSCMVDLLGRAGCLNEAENFIQHAMPTYIIGWRSLLNSCKMHGDIQMGRRCFEHIVFLDGHCDSAHVLMSNIYANADMQKVPLI